MKIIKDLVPVDGANIYRFERLNPDGTGTGEYAYWRYAPGDLAQEPTPVNAALLEDMYGYSNETITLNEDGSVTTVSGGVTETTSIAENGVVTTTKTDGTKTITMTMTVNEDNTIGKAVN